MNIALTDPASLLLVRELPRFAAAYAIAIEIRWQAPKTRAGDKTRLAGAAQLASALGDSVSFEPLERLATGLSATLVDALAMAPTATLEQLQDLHSGFEAYWSGDESEILALVSEVTAQKIETAKVRYRQDKEVAAARGLFAPGFIAFAGDRYLGLERAHYLQARLDEMGLCRDREAATALHRRLGRLRPSLDARKPATRELAVYFSFRSPYSYLALARLVPYCTHQDIRLMVHPVLPMVQRGVALSSAKRRYILRDAAREARRQRIPFAPLRDPLPAVDGLLHTLLSAAETARPVLALALMRLAWAEGRSLVGEDERRGAARATGVSIGKSVERERVDNIVAHNHAQLSAMGHWGVPVLVCDQANVWGQDRFPLFLHSTIRGTRST